MRLTMRVGLPHLGQSVLLVVSMTFFRSAVFAIFAPTAIIPFLPRYLNFAQHEPLGFQRMIVDEMPSPVSREGFSGCVFTLFRRI